MEEEMIAGLDKNTTLGNASISASRKWIGGNCSAHWHEFYEMEYIISGNGTYTINGQPFPMKSGMLYFMTPTDFHSVYTEKAEIINVMFSESLVTSAYLAPFTYHAAPKTLPIPENMQDFFLMLLAEAVDFQENLTYSAALLDCLLLKLSRSLLSYEEDNWNSTAQKIHFYLINHFRDKVCLNDVAQYVGLTPTYVSAVFKKEMGNGFKKYLDKLRFAYARKLLLYSELSITQICGESGFEDYPNFIRRFKEHFGVTPTEMRMGRTD